VCAVGAFKQSVKMNFFQGAFLEDPQETLQRRPGCEKNASHRFPEGDVVDEPALKELIRAAVAYNGGRKKRMTQQKAISE